MKVVYVIVEHVYHSNFTQQEYDQGIFTVRQLWQNKFLHLFIFFIYLKPNKTFNFI